MLFFLVKGVFFVIMGTATLHTLLACITLLAFVAVNTVLVALLVVVTVIGSMADGW